MSSLRLSFLLAIFVAVGTLATYFSAQVPVQTEVNPGGSGRVLYGFPITWKTTLEEFCSPFYPDACPTPIYTTSYDWLGFMADVLFYTLIGCGLSLAQRRYRAGEDKSGPSRPNK